MTDQSDAGNPTAGLSARREARDAPWPLLLSGVWGSVPATGIFSLPFHDWCPIRVYSPSPSAIGARY
eukprot:576406-Prorocentrum_minimum.AAC.1